MTTEDLQTPLGLSERFSIWSSQLLPRAMGRMNLRLIRWSGGRLGTTMRGIPIGVLTATGRRSGQPRSVPLMYYPHAGDPLVLSCNSGLDRPPAWLLNLQADPRATFEHDGHTDQVRAEVLSADERAAVWPDLVEFNRVWAGFQAATDRQIEVVRLRPVT